MQQVSRMPAASIALALALFVLGGCATQAQKSAGETVDDAVIASTVKSKLIGTKGISANDINVEVYKGHVQLAGFVGTESAKSLAVSVAKSVSGITGVTDGMVVFTEARSAGEVFDDGVLASKVKSAIAQVEMGKALDVNVEVRKMNVLLSGFVPTNGSRVKAVEAASSVAGVAKVYDKIEIGT